MSIYLIWFLIGMGFLIAELISPAFILFFFGLGAWVTSIAIALFPDLTFNQQVIIFSSSSIALLLVLRNYVKIIFLGNQNKDKHQSVNDELKENSLARISKSIKPGEFGEIKFKGTFYKAKSDNLDVELEEGESVTVIKQGDEQGSFYLVKK